MRMQRLRSASSEKNMLQGVEAPTRGWSKVERRMRHERWVHVEARGADRPALGAQRTNGDHTLEELPLHICQRRPLRQPFGWHAQ